MPHRSRDRHLFQTGPKRILSLDGGGVRGVITLAFLEQIEAELKKRHGGDPGFRLATYFDLIGGTSTGAIIATGLALGMRVKEVKQMYFRLAPLAFRRVLWRVPGVFARFSARPLQAALADAVGQRMLDSPDLLTGLAIIAKRMDTGAPWVLSNNPRAPYWDDSPEQAHVGNRHYRLAMLVRASAAASMFFIPERIEVAPGQPAGLFIDGAVSPHNNPALQLLMLVAMRAFGLCWPVGPENLLMISVGTGSHRPRLDPDAASRATAAMLATRALGGLIADGQHLVLTLLQWLSDSASPWPLNSEIGDLAGDVLGGRALLAFQRYDLSLDAGWLARELDMHPSAPELQALRRIDRVTSMPLGYSLGSRAAERQVQSAHFPTWFDLPAAAPQATD